MAIILKTIMNVFHKSNRRAAPRAAFHGVAFTSRTVRQILVHVGGFVKTPKIPSALNNESILVKILG